MLASILAEAVSGDAQFARVVCTALRHKQYTVIVTRMGLYGNDRLTMMSVIFILLLCFKPARH